LRTRKATPAKREPGPQKLLVKSIERAILRKYLVDQSGWGVLREVSIDDLAAVETYRAEAGLRPSQKLTRHHRRKMAAPTVRRIDFLLMRISRRSKPRHERIALEVKVTRADFKRDTAEKRAAWFAVSDRFAYVAPVGMIQPEEVPEGCGLIEFNPEAIFGSDVLKWKVLAPKKSEPPAPFDTQFFAYLFGRASRAEDALRGAS
jgi:hypothetical protein